MPEGSLVITLWIKFICIVKDFKITIIYGTEKFTFIPYMETSRNYNLF